MSQFELLYLDNHLLVVGKPAGMLVQGDKTGDVSLLDHAKTFLKHEFQKPGNVFLGLVHRLDRPVSGVVVFARTSKAASRLSEQFRTRQVQKTYWALVEGKIPPSGHLTDQVARNGVQGKIVASGSGKQAELSFRRLDYRKRISLVEIDLGTGRHHQIRLQLAHLGFPILGDFRYGSRIAFPDRTLALHARSLGIEHPVKREWMTFKLDPGEYWMSRFQF